MAGRAKTRWAERHWGCAASGSLRADALPALDDPGATVVRAAYSKPYEAHAPIAPSCAVALVEDDHLTVWTHSQGIHPLRQELAGQHGTQVSVHFHDPLTMIRRYAQHIDLLGILRL